MARPRSARLGETRPIERVRLAFSRTEAADALGVSVDFFDEHIAHEVRVVRRGRRRLYSLTELERWLANAATLALETKAHERKQPDRRQRRRSSPA